MPDRPPSEAFVSYRRQDPNTTWVRRTLVPALEAAGLRICVDLRAFRLKHSSVAEMGRAVARPSAQSLFPPPA